MHRPAVEVNAPSRLHFGLLSFGRRDEPQFGGVGVMVQRPGIRLTVRPADRLEAHGPLAVRAREFARRVAKYLEMDEPPRCLIKVESAPQQHVGLGTGTQLGLSVAAGLARAFDLSLDSPQQLAAAVGRGKRSSVGSYGFCFGGLLYDEVRGRDDKLGSLQQRIEVPETWRWLLICPRDQQGLSGERERAAFEQLPTVPPDTTATLRAEMRQQMLPALQRADFAAFSESVYRYGHAAGMCFARLQGGPFASQAISEIIAYLRNFGIRGVGQSSWGPHVFALVENECSAEQLEAQVVAHFGEDQVDTTISAPNNSGAYIKRLA